MVNQLYLNILISLIIGFSISYYYLQKINLKFLFYSVILFLISYVILHCLGPKNTIESFNNEESIEIDNELNDKLKNKINDELKNEEDFQEENNQEMEEVNQMEEIENQEEYIRNAIEEEELEEETFKELKDKELKDEELKNEEEDNSIDKEKIVKNKLLQQNLFNKAISGNNNQFNPGIGIGVSPVNIYINGEKVGVDKFKNNKEKSNKNHDDNDLNKCEDNYYKKASRIHNNSDWVYDKKEWCDDTYNYDKKCGSDNNLLPCAQPEVNKIPQTLNNLINTKKNDKNSEPCPLDVNKPWSIYKTGDDKEKNEIIPEGFNL